MPAIRHNDNNANTLTFNVIVTFVISEQVSSGLHYGELLMSDFECCVSGTQAIFDLNINIYKTSTYDSIMRRVKRQVVRQCTKWFELNESDMVKISTAGNLKRWEKLTGNEYATAASSSNVTTDGKFYLSDVWGRVA